MILFGEGEGGEGISYPGEGTSCPGPVWKEWVLTRDLAWKGGRGRRAL